MTQGHYQTPGMPGGKRTSPAAMAAVIVGAVVLAGGIVAAVLLFGGRKDQPSATQPADAKPAPVVLPGPAIEASATDMLVMFKDKQAEAEEKYKGRVVDVTGSVFQKGDNLAGERAITLEGGTQSKFAGVRCVFPPANYFQLDEVERGENVTIRGRFDALVSDVVLRDCAVLKRGD